MVSLRHFTNDDCELLRSCRYPDMSYDEISGMISEWNPCLYGGRYFEMFAVVSGESPVGSVSIYEHSPSVCEIGPEIFPSERNKGYASEAMSLALMHAAEKGYRLVLQQVRTDNRASIKLHEKLGFERLDSVYRNRKGNEVFLYIRII